MIFKLLILLLNTGILVHSDSIETGVKPFNESANMVYGWNLEISKERWRGVCFGTFIAPQVYITDPVCLESINHVDENSIIIISKGYRGNKTRDDISVHFMNIFYSEDLDRTFNRNKRKIAVVIIDEPVRPEQDKNGYVKINSNLNDIDTKKCYVPHYNNWDTTRFTYCDHVLFDNHYGNPVNIYCVSSENVDKLGSGLFCALKTNPDVNVLVGIIVGPNNGIKLWNDPNRFIATVENLSGLYDPIMDIANIFARVLRKYKTSYFK
ncbi:uncharacterized protein LOC130672957 [Microplitis mediator]|uniref:uncharacterized protein LOC130672957 n=1 Tax=Microplitis mediator TaxID=375433 RepID=UPI002553042E|nr:uncharacterized protein LOC130672957 [Microplitis mediator]